MEIYVFDRNLTFIGITDGFESLRWIRKYNKSGEFELQCASTAENLQLLQRENIVYKKDDTEAGYIETINIKEDNDGKEILVIKGKFLTSYLNRRIIWGTILSSSTVELTMRNLVNTNCITPLDQNRIINNLILGEISNFTETADYQVSYANLLDELENLSNVSDLGFKVEFDISNKKLVFKVFKGVDRSINQDANQRVIFSKEFDNILEQEYTDSLNNYKNLVLVGGMGEGSERKLAVVGASSGLDRFEIFNDQKSLSNEVDNTTLSDSEYMNLLIGKGQETLVDTKEIKTFTSKVNLDSNTQYKVDFDLGDIITMSSSKWGLTLDSRITEIEEVYEENGFAINVVFGNKIPTLIDKVKIMSKQKSSGGSATPTPAPITDIDGGVF